MENKEKNSLLEKKLKDPIARIEEIKCITAVGAILSVLSGCGALFWNDPIGTGFLGAASLLFMITRHTASKSLNELRSVDSNTPSIPAAQTQQTDNDV
jgi:hypothetical protein